MHAYRRGSLSEAESLCRDILRGQPYHVGGLFLLAVVRTAVGDDEAAAGLFQATLTLDPALADANGNLAMIRQRQGHRAEATRLFQRATRLAPDNLDWRISHAMLCLEQPGTAARHFRSALALAPTSAAAWRGLGLALRGNDPAQAAIAFDRAFRLDPSLQQTQSEAFACRLRAAEWQHYDRDRQSMEVCIDQGGIVLPLLTQIAGIDPARQRRAAETVWQWQVAGDPPPSLSRKRHDDRLTVAYLSADFHEHATAYLITGLLEQHDRSRFRILAGCYGTEDDSAARQRIRRSVDGFHILRDLDVGQVAEWAAEQGIDILVDLKGYTAGARLDLLSRRLATVQVAYLGYPGTLGGGPVDYLVGDSVVTPPADQPYYHERLVILPGCYQVNDRNRPRPDTMIDRGSLGLPPDGFVFGALNAPQKITPDLFGCWMRVLKATPDAHLMLYDPNGTAAANLRAAATRLGVDPGRLTFVGAAPLAQHLARYRAIDLCLDSFPYTGHTTTSDALWMGVPVVTRQGDGFAARVAASLLHAVGLPELITHDLAGYEALALSLERDRARLDELKAHLERVRDTAPLFDTPAFARHLERAYRLMWERHCASLPPQTLIVPPQD
ncbi:hypothetical protein C0V82_22305 (plasmid) [Niveispirillum cyanobacteriorum]|uniref:protein O-GlcNAc transferase n=2 Tax=Niveispirillum cyanobacteriorum TaxID=1612173 RepID=A0A2K9NKR8_9PROT|nr:hypothetical protein C0V82_22305 [Niveispirillum cyanobacteriorum]GGE51482.1 hypothetical protein GCM10011317_07290 [Niveispirillum cyanobacteriorum]